MNLWCAVRLSSAPRIDGSRSRRRLRGGGNGLAVSRRLLHLFFRLLFGCGKHRGRSRGERRERPTRAPAASPQRAVDRPLARPVLGYAEDCGEQNKVVLVATG